MNMKLLAVVTTPSIYQFEIVESMTFVPDEVMIRKFEYIDNSSVRAS